MTNYTEFNIKGVWHTWKQSLKSLLKEVRQNLIKIINRGKKEAKLPNRDESKEYSHFTVGYTHIADKHI